MPGLCTRMGKLIGIDTGGTYTDAVLFDETRGVLAKAKALTTRHDLSEGIGAVLDAVLSEGGIQAGEIGLVSLSTTLATNAIVEGQGGRIGLVMIGFAARDLDRGGLKAAVREDAAVLIGGGHDAFGTELAPLDLTTLDAWLAEQGSTVTGFAVAGQFSIANPDHEARVRGAIEARTGRPVTCSHELTSRLDGPKRALTAVLNARLVPIIHHLIDATQALLARRAFTSPLMIVKGDGSLLSVAEARRKPVETILSGPAASLVGASFLCGLPSAVVSDIGGTTTDIGLIEDGRPRLDPEGAVVGGHATFVEAVRLRTFGLGADSDVSLDPGGLRLGPRRVIPISLLAASHPAEVHRQLDRHLAMPAPPETAGRFAVATGSGDRDHRRYDSAEAEVLDLLRDGPCPLDKLAGAYRRRIALARLTGFGEVAIAAFCPSDAAHVLDLHEGWDRDAAIKAATLFGRRRGAGGRPLEEDPGRMSRAVLDALIRTSAERLLDVALGEDGLASDAPSRHPLLQAALSRRRGLAEITVRLTSTLVGLGASAATYYPAVGAMLGAEVLVPRHADVANAVGAVVGRVRAEALAVVSRPDDGLYRVHGGEVPRDFHDLDAALRSAEDAAAAAARGEARRNGAHEVELRVIRDVVSARVADRDIVLEWRIRALVTGRPAVGSPTRA